MDGDGQAGRPGNTGHGSQQFLPLRRKPRIDGRLDVSCTNAGIFDPIPDLPE